MNHCIPFPYCNRTPITVLRQSFFLSKTIQKSKSILQDGSRSFGLFRKGKTGIIAKLHRTDFVIRSHSRERKTASYSQRNSVRKSKRNNLGINFHIHETFVVTHHWNCLAKLVLMRSCNICFCSEIKK